MALFRKRDKRSVIDEKSVDDQILRALLGQSSIDREAVMNIPAVNSCVNRIGDTVASLPIKLYKREKDRVVEVKDDTRLKLLNNDTGDTLDGFHFKKSMIDDMYLGKGGYAYVNKVNGEVKSLHYVEDRHISYLVNEDPIFKDYQIMVNGQRYEGYQFIQLYRSTKNGYTGKSIVDESPLLYSIVKASQEFEERLVKSGGNKKGFLESQNRLSLEAMKALKQAFRNLYSNNTENVVVLNEGLSFKESSNTSVELQLNENKETNNDDICKVFLIPPSIINGGATDEDRKEYHTGCIVPILTRFATALDKVLLTEEEKETLFFAFDDTELTKGDIEKRFGAYKIALDSGFMQVDEVREKEKLPAFDLDFIKLGLQDVLYFPKNKTIYTPNTNKISGMDESNQDTPTDPEDQKGELDGDSN